MAKPNREPNKVVAHKAAALIHTSVIIFRILFYNVYHAKLGVFFLFQDKIFAPTMIINYLCVDF